jgi:hypothetical protein
VSKDDDDHDAAAARNRTFCRMMMMIMLSPPEPDVVSKDDDDHVVAARTRVLFVDVLCISAKVQRPYPIRQPPSLQPLLEHKRRLRATEECTEYFFLFLFLYNYYLRRSNHIQ